MNFKFLQNVLVIDIETVSLTNDYESLPERLKALWAKKSSFIRSEEDLSVQQLYLKKAGIFAEFGKVIAIAVGVFHQNASGDLCLRVKSFYGDDEEKVLLDFKELVEEKFKSEQLKLCAHNGKEFDYPYLCRRMLLNKIDIPLVLDLRNRKPWEVQHMDTLDMWKFGDRKNFTSLDLMTAIFGIESSKEDEDGDPIDGSMVNEVYYEQNGLERINKYCKNDVVATAQLFLRLHNKDIIDKTNITIL